GDPEDAIRDRRTRTGIVDEGPVALQLVAELERRLARVFERDAEDDDASVPVPAPRGGERVVFLAARHAPRRPEVHDHHLPVEVAEVDRAARIELWQRERWGRLADQLARELARVPAEPRGEQQREQHERGEHQRDGPPPTPRAPPAAGFDALVDTSLVRVVDPSVHTVTSSRCSATCSGPVALAARGRVGQAATMPPSAITAPPSHSSPIPGFTKNRNDA